MLQESYSLYSNVYDELNPITFAVAVEPWGEDKKVEGDITIGQGK